MEDCNISSDLRHLAHGQVKALEYSRYDINGYHFRTAKLEASRPLAATCNRGVGTSGEAASVVTTDYYGVLQKIIEYTFGGTKELNVVFFQCDWFDPIHSTKVDDFGMVEVKHESRYSGINHLLAHQAQQVYYLSYPHKRMKNGGWYIKLILKYTLVDMMSTWKEMRRRMSIKKELKKAKTSRYLTGQDSQN
jgi:hypothetical protein